MLVAQDVSDHRSTKRQLGREECAVKVDMKKPYDNLECGFLALVIAMMGFEEQWINWISTCVSGVSTRLC